MICDGMDTRLRRCPATAAWHTGAGGPCRGHPRCASAGHRGPAARDQGSAPAEARPSPRGCALDPASARPAARSEQERCPLPPTPPHQLRLRRAPHRAVVLQTWPRHRRPPARMRQQQRWLSTDTGCRGRKYVLTICRLVLSLPLTIFHRSTKLTSSSTRTTLGTTDEDDSKMNGFFRGPIAVSAYSSCQQVNFLTLSTSSYSEILYWPAYFKRRKCRKQFTLFSTGKCYFAVFAALLLQTAATTCILALHKCLVLMVKYQYMRIHILDSYACSVMLQPTS